MQLTIGHYDDARDTFEQVLTLAQALDDARLTADALNRLGEVAGRLGLQERDGLFTPKNGFGRRGPERQGRRLLGEQ